MIVPDSIALEHQTWMDDRALAALWLPGSPPGLCRQCALGHRVCVQVRNSLEMGQPPMYFHHGGRGAHGPGKPRYDGRGRGVKHAWEKMGSMSATGALEEEELGGEPTLDERCFV